MPNIVILDGYVLNPGDVSWEPFSALGELQIYDRTASEDILTRAIGADYLLVNKVVLDKKILLQLPRLKCICLLATGYNNIDILAARELGIDVCNAGEYGSMSVAQHVFAMLLHMTNHVALHNSSVHQGEWSQSTDWCYSKKSTTELTSQTLGIIGYGSIGSQVAKIGLALGMNVKTVNRNHKSHIEGPVTYVSKEEIFSSSDVLSLHVPLTDETIQMINKKTLLTMKKSAILINTARGGLINEEDLHWALEHGVIAGACLDVLSSEPPQEDHPLTNQNNCVITPHIAWATMTSRIKLIRIVADNLKAHLEGSPINVVN